MAKSGIETAQNEHPKVWLTDFADHFFNEHIERLAAEYGYYQILAGSSYGDGSRGRGVWAEKDSVQDTILFSLWWQPISNTYNTQ